MSARLDNLKQLFGNLRTRSILLATGGVVLLVVIVGVIGLGRSTQEAPANVTVTTVKRIQSTPGLQQVTPEYAKVQAQLNQQNYDKAIKNKTSAIPTIIGIDEAGAGGMNGTANGTANGAANGAGAGGANGQGNMNGPGAVNGMGNVNGAGDANALNGANANGASGANGANGSNTLSPTEQQLQDQLTALKRQQQEALANNPAYQQQLQKVQQSMQTQAQQLVSSWSGKGGATQVYVASSVNVTKTPAEIAEVQAEAAAAQASAPIIKAGDIVFAVLTTGVNSDEPSPVMATILSGPLKGGKLIGRLQQTASLPGTNGPTKVILDFNVMSIPSAASSVSVNAVAIDPDTARTALASDVDHHYLSRYGSVFAAAFLQGYGNAIQQSGTQVMVGPLGNTTIAAGSLTGIEEVAAGVGQVGQEWGNQLNDALSRQNTVTVNAGISIGILFLNDVTLNEQNYAIPGQNQPPILTINPAQNGGTNQSSEGFGSPHNITNLAPAPATVIQGNNVQGEGSSVIPSNTVQSRQIAPGVTQQWGPVYPIYTEQQ